MGKEFTEIDNSLREWIARQHVFFVATAPLSSDGMINCSPKGTDSFRVMGPKTIAYLDLTGSGVETIAHVKQNGRIVVMMCAFEGPPRIVRFHGAGRVHELGQPGFSGRIGNFTTQPGARAIIEINLNRISDSCGYSVPLYAYEGERDALVNWARGKGESGLCDYRAQKNQVSFEGLPGFGGSPEAV